MTPQDIKDLRLKLGLSQAKFAEKIGTRQGTISLWESGQHAISHPWQVLIKQFAESKL